MLDKYVSKMQEIFSRSLPAFKSVDVHAGRFDLDDVRRMSAKTPALLVSCLSLGDVVPAPAGRQAVLHMAAFVLVSAGRGAHGERIDRDAAALKFVDGVLAVLDGEAWTLEPPQSIEADNLCSAGKLAVALWAVTWNQPVLLGAPQCVLENLDEFLRMHVEWDPAPQGAAPEVKEMIEVRRNNA